MRRTTFSRSHAGCKGGSDLSFTARKVVGSISLSAVFFTSRCNNLLLFLNCYLQKDVYFGKYCDVGRIICQVRLFMLCATNKIISLADNVGGETLDTVLKRINIGARVVICGAISGYNATAKPSGPRNYMR